MTVNVRYDADGQFAPQARGYSVVLGGIAKQLSFELRRHLLRSWAVAGINKGSDAEAAKRRFG